MAAGRVPPSEAQRMRCPHQAGDFPFPVKYGYATVGVVTEGAPELSGKAVFCLHPHQTTFNIPAAHAHVVPEGVPYGRAVLAANAETALNGVWDCGAGPGDRVAVLGAGVVGLLCAWIVSSFKGSEVLLADPDERKREAAQALGLTLSHPDELAGCDADAVLECSGAESGLRAAMTAAGFEARVTVLSWFGDQAPALPLGSDFHSKRLTLAGSQVGAVAPSRRSRWTHGRRLRKALELLRAQELDALITGETAFEDLPRRLPELARSGQGVLCERVKYQHG